MSEKPRVNYPVTSKWNQDLKNASPGTQSIPHKFTLSVSCVLAQVGRDLNIWKVRILQEIRKRASKKATVMALFWKNESYKAFLYWSTVYLQHQTNLVTGLSNFFKKYLHTCPDTTLGRLQYSVPLNQPKAIVSSCLPHWLIPDLASLCLNSGPSQTLLCI
jgi:hypothetical protein